jgi:hypothetical protein
MIGARKVLEVVTNISILIVCGLICYTLITHKTLNLRTIFAGGGRGSPSGRPLPAASAWLPLGRSR